MAAVDDEVGESQRRNIFRYLIPNGGRENLAGNHLFRRPRGSDAEPDWPRANARSIANLTAMRSAKEKPRH